MDKNKLRQDISKIPVVLLAGGRGTPTSRGEIIPKAMIDVNARPLILYLLRQYAQVGFKKFIICTGLRGDLIKKYFELLRPTDFIDNSLLDIKIVDTGIDTMTGSRIARIKELLEHSPFFCLTYTDTVSNVNLIDLLEFHIKHKKTATLVAAHVPTRFRILGLYGEDDLVKGFSKEPLLKKDYINGGFYIFNSSIFNLKSLKADSSCTLENEVLEELVSRKQLAAFRYSGFWHYVDTERDRLRLCLEYSKSNSK